MPIYEYQCQTCGEVTEKLQKFSDDPLRSCGCGGNLDKLVSRSSFQLKGSGWYVSDYKTKDKGRSAASVGSSSSPEKNVDTAKSADSTKKKSD
jgi:putative FmdB family regulatory protein